VDYTAFYEKPFLKFDRLLHSYLAYAPAVMARLCGRDFLSLKPDPAAASYWIMKPVGARQPQEYEQQF
jgi:hypothetical protein